MDREYDVVGPWEQQLAVRVCWLPKHVCVVLLYNGARR